MRQGLATPAPSLQLKKDWKKTYTSLWYSLEDGHAPSQTEKLQKSKNGSTGVSVIKLFLFANDGRAE